MTLLASIVEAAKSLYPLASLAGLVGAGCAFLSLQRAIRKDAEEAATARATLTAQVAGLVERVADDRGAAQRRGGHVALELAGVKQELGKLGDAFASRGERLTAIERDHDGLAGRVEKVERECFARHVGNGVLVRAARGGEPGEDADPDNSAGGIDP